MKKNFDHNTEDFINEFVRAMREGNTAIFAGAGLSVANQKQSAENFIKDIRRKTRRLFSSEQKIMIVMEALRGETSTAEICRN
jgi:hypothetical protein